jgi:thioesterase domain-containing protein
MIVRNWHRILTQAGLLKKRRDDAAETDKASPESYDQWLLNFLQDVTAKYEPRRHPIRIVVLRSREEPTGWFFRPDAGWGAFTSEKIELAFVDGNHYTMFKNPGVAELARHVSRALDAAASSTR